QLIQRVQLVGIGAEERVKFYLIPVFDGQRNVAHLGQTAADNDAEFLLEIFFGNRPCRHAHRGFTRGRTSAAAIVAKAIFLFVGIVGVARTEDVFNRAVVLGALIGVFNQQTNAGPGGTAFKNAGENFDLVRLATLRGVAR